MNTDSGREKQYQGGATCELDLGDEEDFSRQPQEKALQTRQLDKGISLEAARKRPML